MKQDALDFLEQHKKREYTHDRHSIDYECVEYVPLHIAKMALDMMSENKEEIIAEKYATVTEEKELLLKDLCERLPYGVMVQIISRHPIILGDGNESDEFDEPYNVSLTIDDHDSLVDFFNGDWVTDIKPYLRPMSSMTEEEKKMMRSYGFELILYDTGCTGFANIENYIDEISFRFMEEFLNAHYFDYRGLIPMGLALEAPEGMYNN